MTTHLVVGNYYRRDTGTVAFKLLGPPDPTAKWVFVEFYPSGSRRTVEVGRIVEVRSRYMSHYCPKCPNDEFRGGRCWYCGWSPDSIKLPKNYKPKAQAEAAQIEGTEDMSNTLYRLNEDGKDPEYVRRVGTDGNLAVIKSEVTGNLRAVDPKLLEEVLPYTVGIKFSATGPIYHYLADEGQFEKGDLLVSEDSSSLAHVHEINTKSKRADKRFSGWKIAMTRITG